MNTTTPKTAKSINYEDPEKKAQPIRKRDLKSLRFLYSSDNFNSVFKLTKWKVKDIF